MGREGMGRPLCAALFGTTSIIDPSDDRVSSCPPPPCSANLADPVFLNMYCYMAGRAVALSNNVVD